MMNDGQQGIELLSALSAVELGRLQRRQVFLEAALTQLLRDRGQLREWFTASELAAMLLPGLPKTRNGITHMARARGWETIVTSGRGGERQLFHFASLPRRAFEGMIDLVLRSPAAERQDGEAATAKLPAMSVTACPAMAANATPAWVLPLLRILRGCDSPALDKALQRLPDCMGASVACPSLEEAQSVLTGLGVRAR